MKACALGVPAAVVCANHAFESWFLADLASVRGVTVKAAYYCGRLRKSSSAPS